jgi:hypothetical protein
MRAFWPTIALPTLQIMITRRAALALLGGVALVDGAGACTPAPLGYQLYSSRRFGPRPATLGMLADTG